MAQATAIESSLDEDLVDEVDGPTPELEPHHEPTIEEIAREMGWKPLSEYNGPPGKWSDARTFVQRGESILPIMRAQNRELISEAIKSRKQVDSLTRTVTEQGLILNDLRKLAQNSEDRGYKKALADLKQQQRDAVAAADTVAYEQVSEQIETLQTARTEAVSPPPAPKAPEVPQEIQDFIAANAWFNRDKMLNQQMIAAHEKVIRKHPGASLAKQLELARAVVVADFPDAFPDEVDDGAGPAPAPRSRSASVATPTRTPTNPGTRRSPGIDGIEDQADRAEARAAFNRMKRQFPDYTEAEYMAIYAEPHGDVLADIKTRKEQRNGK